MTKIEWTRSAIADVRSLRDYIARDSDAYADRFVQKIIDKATEGDAEKIDELVERAQEGAFNTKMCRGLGGKLMCEYIPQDLAQVVIDLVEGWEQQRTRPVDIKEFARKIKLRQD